MAESDDSVKCNNDKRIEVETYVILVNTVRTERKLKSEEALNEIIRRMNTKLKQISYKFRIPGFAPDDIYQEALFALRYKAINDYDHTRGNQTGPYPFDRFAILCIRRHLATKLKASYQHKHKVTNTAVSLDQERRFDSEESLCLGDIVPAIEGNVLNGIEENEYYKRLFSKLAETLSSFEKDVFTLYKKKYSYHEIAAIIAKKNGKKNVHRGAIKSIDNALSRIKIKSKDIFEQFGEK